MTLFNSNSDKPRTPSITQDKFYPLEGDLIVSRCTFSARPPANVFYTKENQDTGEWERVDSEVSTTHLLTFIRSYQKYLGCGIYEDFKVGSIIQLFIYSLIIA